MKTPPFPAVEIYRQMLRMRRFEEALADLWEEGRISGELHLGIGEEGIAAGVTNHLVPGDALALDHRPTPALVGIGTDLTLMVQEMLGSAEGLCHGQGGHMHLFDPERFAASSGIVGASGPMACGFALSAKQRRPRHIAVAFLGESAINQGMLLESMNLARVWNLPVLFVVKDNGWAITTRSRKMTAAGLRKRAEGFDLEYRRVDGSDVRRVWATAGRLIDGLRRGASPAMLHATCHRPSGHFEHDPLIRMVTDVKTLREESGPLVRSVAFGDGRATRRMAGMGRVLATAGRMRLHLLSRRDPVGRLGRSLEPSVVERVRAGVDSELARTLEEAGVA